MAACATRKRRSYTFMRSIQAFRVALTPMGACTCLKYESLMCFSIFLRISTRVVCETER
jgi:hypothetical protein